MKKLMTLINFMLDLCSFGCIMLKVLTNTQMLSFNSQVFIH